MSWIDEYRQMPKSFDLVEKHDRAKLEDALNHPRVNKETKLVVQGILDNMDSNGNLTVTYSRGDYGRWYPQGPCSTRLWKKVRWASLPADYIDIDIVNTNVNIAAHLGRQLGINYDKINQFATNRQLFYDILLSCAIPDIESYQATIGDSVTPNEMAKHIMTAKLNGAGNGIWSDIGITDPFLKKYYKGKKNAIVPDLIEQWKSLSSTICHHEEYKDIINYGKNKKGSEWRDNSGMVTVLSTFEAFQVFKQMRALMEQWPGCVTTYEYDGFHVDLDIVRSIEDNSRADALGLVNNLLRKLNSKLPVTFIVKGRGQTIFDIDWDTCVPTVDVQLSAEDARVFALAQKHPSTELGIAEILRAEFGEKIICTALKHGEYYTCKDNGYWKLSQLGPYGKINEYLVPAFTRILEGFQGLPMVGDMPEKIYTLSQGLKLMSGHKSSVIATKFAQLTYDEEFTERLDKAPYLVGFLNGVYDLETGTFRNCLPTDYLTINVGYDYDEKADDKEVDAFIEAILPNKEVREYFMAWCATCLEGRNHQQKITFLTGKGGNGKSAIVKLLTASIKGYDATLPPSFLTNPVSKSNESPSPQLLKIAKSRFGVQNEIEKGSILTESLAKTLSGADEVSGRGLYKEQATQVRSNVHLCLAANELCKIEHNDAMKRRVVVIEFTERFKDGPTAEEKRQGIKEIDHTIEGKTDSWRPTFMNRLLAYYEKYRESGRKLIQPPVIEEMTARVMNQYDEHAKFISDNLEQDPEGWCRLTDVWNFYRDQRGSLRSQQALKAELTKRLGAPTLGTKAKNKGVLVFNGWNLRGVQDQQVYVE